MSELSLIRRSNNIDGILIPQSDYTLWLYGINKTQWTYVTEPVFVSSSSFWFTGSPSSITVYDVSWANGVVTLSNATTVSSSTWESASGRYALYGNGIYKVSSFGTNSDGNYGWALSGYLDNVIAPSLTYYGHVYSKDSSKFPDGDTLNGIYYKKKTNLNFNIQYW